MHPPRPRPRIIDKQRPEATTASPAKVGPGVSDRNVNVGVPGKLRKGAEQAYTMLARRNAALAGGK